MNAEAVICGEAPSSMIKERVKKGLLTFRDDERRYRSLIKYLKYPIYTYHSLVFNKCYLLCASAFGARDYRLSGMDPNKCYKWGYFPEVSNVDDIENIISLRHKHDSAEEFEGISILWVGRLIGLKHPEMALKLAENLKKAGHKFSLNIIGDGYLYNQIEKKIIDEGLSDCVHQLGALGNGQVQQYMMKSDIFIFTSDQNEGWGAVLNEAMSNGCAVVASHAIGSVPYLIEDKHNGLIFRSENNADLYDKVKWLIDNPSKRVELGRNAYYTLKNQWGPQQACDNLIALIAALSQGKDTPIANGPCSKAAIMNHNNWL